MRSPLFVRGSEVPSYSPANHDHTHNQRLIGPANGARHLEVVLGTIAAGGGALPHAHPSMEQVCYLLEGRARAETADLRRALYLLAVGCLLLAGAIAALALWLPDPAG